MSAYDRVETGPVQFGNDWPGFFLRGDSAADLAMVLYQMVHGSTDPVVRVQALVWVGHLKGTLL